MTERVAQQLLGAWTVIRAELGGEAMPPEAAARVGIEFDSSDALCASLHGEYRVRFAGEVSDAGRFELLAQTENHPHRQITLHGKVGTNAGRTLPGIFQLKGDRLRICLALEGKIPPIEFASNRTANAAPCYLVTYRRQDTSPSR